MTTKTPTQGRTITRSAQVLYVAVGALAVWVGAWGFFAPEHVDWALPWTVPPLHSRFLGAIYLSGAVFMFGALRARTWNEVRVVTPMITVWTGTLFLVSALHLSEFDFTRRQTWVWFAAYLLYPIAAAWITWLNRSNTTSPAAVPDVSGAVKVYLAAQGVVVICLAVGLLLAPFLAVGLWPWAITPLLAQMYSAPFLSYGLGSLYAVRQSTFAAIRLYLVGTLVFTLGVLVASVLHLALFSATRASTWLWFAAFSLVTASLGVATAIGIRRPRYERS